MRKFWIASATLLSVAALPSAAFASKPVHTDHHPQRNAPPTGIETKPSHRVPIVMYVLRGTLTAYTAATQTADGSVTITVKGSNFEPKILKGMSLTFTTSTTTKIVTHKGSTITALDRGIVKLRTIKKADATTLEATTAFQVIDQGLAHRLTLTVTTPTHPNH